MTLNVSSNAQSVLLAVQNLFYNPNTADKQKANRWLEEFQKSVFAWETCNELLELNHDVNSICFAAQTMKTKILYSFKELPPNTHEALRDSLLNHIEKLCNISPVLTKQLSLAICDLALQMASWRMPAVTFITKYSKDQSAIPYLLEILTVLPEEVHNQALRLGANRKKDVLEDMENSGPMVISVLQECHNSVSDEVTMCKILKCLGSWFQLCILPGNHVSRTELMHMPFNVLRDSNVLSTLHEAATDCICAALYAAEDVSKYRDLTEFLFRQTHSLRDAYSKAKTDEDTDKCLNLCRIFTELAESLLEPLINTPGEGLGDLSTLDLLLLGNEHYQYEVAEVTFNLWYRLAAMLFANENFAYLSIFCVYIERLICSLVRHCQMEPDNVSLLDEGDDFSDFRMRAAELARDTVYLVGATKCFCQLFGMLKDERGNPVGWDVTEAVLFVMSSIAKLVDLSEETVVPQVIEAILAAPQNGHPAIRLTSVRLIGELSLWVDKHPGYLDHVITFLIGALQQKEMSSMAAQALQYLCEACRQHMVQHYEGLTQLMQRTDELGLSKESSIGLLKGVVFIVSQLPYALLQQSVFNLCQAQVASLQNHKDDKDRKDPTAWLDRLAAIFRNVDVKRVMTNGAAHPCKEVAEQVWLVLKPTLLLHRADNKIVEHWCRCVRFIVRCCGDSVRESMLGPVAETITSVYAQSPHSCFLYLGSVLVDEYCNDASLLAMLNAFAEPTFAILKQEAGLENNPDTVDDLFRLCARFVEKCPIEFLSHPACPAIFDCALVGLSHDQRDANASVCKFLRNVVECRPAPPHHQAVDQLVAAYGEKMIDRSLRACLFELPTYIFADIAELWWSMIQRSREAFSAWFLQALKNLPTEATLATATPEQALQFHNDVVTAKEWNVVNCHLRDFCRLYR